MSGPVVLVTGATSGIGLETARLLAAEGATVVGVARDERRAAQAADALPRGVEWCLADLADPAAIRRLARELESRHPRLDVLVSNAGAMFKDRRLTPEGAEMTLAVNHLAPFLLTTLLLDALGRSPAGRVVVVGSSTHAAGRLDLDDLQLTTGYRQFRAYARSKLANLLFTMELARRLEGTTVTANAVDPGLVRTGLGAGNGPLRLLAWHLIHLRYRRESIGPETAARRVAHVATSPAVAGLSGRWFTGQDPTPAEPAPAARDAALARGLWEASERWARHAGV